MEMGMHLSEVGGLSLEVSGVWESYKLMRVKVTVRIRGTLLI